MGYRAGCGGRFAAVVLWMLGATLACGGPTTLRAKMDQAEGKGREAETVLDEADHEIRDLEVDRAERLLAKARELLADPDITKYPEHGLLKDRVKNSENALVVARQELEKRELERAVLAHRQILESAEARLAKAIEMFKGPELDASRIEESREAISDLEDSLGDASEVEARDKDLAGYVAGVKKKVEAAKTETRKAERALAFREGPLVARREGLDLAEGAKKERGTAKQRELYGEALQRFRLCAEKGKEMLASAPDLAKLSVAVNAKTTSAGAVSTACAKDAEALEKKMRELEKKRLKEEAKAKAKEKAGRAKASRGKTKKRK